MQKTNVEEIEINGVRIEEIEINGIKYVPKSSVQHIEEYEGMKYCIIRTRSAGVFAGYVKHKKGKEVELLRARRLWYWEGAASLSQLAMEGVKYPDKCKFPCEVISVTLTEVIEIIPCTDEAYCSIAKVPIWEK